ncbi:MAG: hypothetical protein EAX96_19620 [Candidatus Lokiarchaeota archaeon]|nr:hypothetical protein [Candidatus Lokiarchaeota archaeon]
MDHDQLMDKRSYFIGDRVMISQVLLLLLTGSLTLIIESLNLSWIFINLWWLICLILPLASIIIIGTKKLSLYFKHHWFITFILLFIVWASFTLFFGLLIDDFVGAKNAFVESLYISAMYAAGYGIARLLRMARHSFSKGVLIGIAVGISSVIIIGTLILGGVILQYGLTLAGVSELFSSTTYSKILTSQTCVNGIYIMLSGIGIVISMGIQYFMFYCLFDPKGLDVEEDPPNELYLKMMIGSMVITFIAWILLLLLIPPIAGGGGGSGKSSNSNSNSNKNKRKKSYYRRTYYYSRYGSYATYGKEQAREVFPPDIVDGEWEEYDLGKK